MKKITKQEAIRQINLGINPKCEVSRELQVPVRSLTELNLLEKKSAVQKFELYGYDEKAIEAFVIPENALAIDVNEATDLLINNEPFYIKVIENEEQKFSKPEELSKFIALFRELTFKGDSFLLYWRDCE